MTFKIFFQSLTDDEQTEFARTALTSVGYIKSHLIYARKVPQPESFNNLMVACDKFDSHITRQELFEFFYSTEKAA